MWKAQQNNFCFCFFCGDVHTESENPFKRAVMCDVVFASENHFCFRWFSLAFITSAFLRFRRGKARKRIEVRTVLKARVLESFFLFLHHFFFCRFSLAFITSPFSRSRRGKARKRIEAWTGLKALNSFKNYRLLTLTDAGGLARRTLTLAVASFTYFGTKL